MRRNEETVRPYRRPPPNLELEWTEPTPNAAKRPRTFSPPDEPVASASAEDGSPSAMPSDASDASVRRVRLPPAVRCVRRPPVRSGRPTRPPSAHRPMCPTSRRRPMSVLSAVRIRWFDASAVCPPSDSPVCIVRRPPSAHRPPPKTTRHIGFLAHWIP